MLGVCTEDFTFALSPFAVGSFLMTDVEGVFRQRSTQHLPFVVQRRVFGDIKEWKSYLETLLDLVTLFSSR